ncbi:MAG: oxygen-independent coproporphyrinogen III oxidase [Paracoccaceae bacterium]
MNNLDRLKRAGLFDEKVPRYTSYPPATKFHAGVGCDEYEQWISGLAAGTDISLYIHIPFCHRLCWYCACRTQGVKTLTPVAAYVEVLKKEIARLAALLPEGVRISRMHWGGGSPTILTPELSVDLLETLREALPLSSDLDFSVEIDPTGADEAKMQALVENGMTRASIGVQDFALTVQKAIGRLQGYEITRDCIETLRRAGIASLNIDIVYGLPFQSIEGLTRTVEKVISLRPDRVALFGYAHVPWMAKRQQMIDEAALPDTETRLALFNRAVSQFNGAGYDSIGIDHFALPTDTLAAAARTGRLRRNFQGYTDDNCKVLLGVGASSISKLPQGYLQNRAATSSYLKAVNAGDCPIARGFELTEYDKVFGRAIEMIMCEFGVSLPRLREEFGELTDAVLPGIDEVARLYPGLVKTGAEGFALTDSGRLIARIVARRFDNYRESASRYSQAI